MSTWTDVAAAAEVTTTPVAATVDGHAIVLFRTESGEPAALEDRCAHRRKPLSTGRVRGAELECRYHLYRYAVDGRCTGAFDEDPPPGTRVTAYPVREDGGRVHVDLTAAGQQERAS